jgi:hypothetical protein
METNEASREWRVQVAKGDDPGTWETPAAQEEREPWNPSLEGIPESLYTEKGCYDMDHAGGCG